MSGISRLSLRDVRCFAEPQEVELGKITLFVGENNSGKSTFLGCLAAFARLASFHDLHDPPIGRPGPFNQWPYHLGDFSTIARDEAEAFVLDGALDGRRHTRVRFTFGARQGHPSERSAEIHFRDPSGAPRRLAIVREPGPPEIWRVRADDFSLPIPHADLSYHEVSTWLSQAVRYGLLPYQGDPSTYRKRLPAAADADLQARFARLTNFLRTMPFDAEPVAVESSPPAPPPRRRRYETDAPGVADIERLRLTLARAGDRLGLSLTSTFSGIRARRGTSCGSCRPNGGATWSTSAMASMRCSPC